MPVADAITHADRAVLDAVAARFDRARPPLADPGFDALTSLPASTSMPSGHAPAALAAAGVVAAMHPRLRIPALAAAALGPPG